MGKVLIIDDDATLSRLLSEMLRRMGHQAKSAMSYRDGLETAQSETFDAVLLDVRLPDGNGLDMISELRAAPSSPEVVIITGNGDAEGAELAIRSGVWDYIEKPFHPKNLTLILRRVLKYCEGKPLQTSPVALQLEGIVGTGPEMRSCLDLLAQAAASKANVLIVGETGTGKELFAWAIHRNSPRAGKNFAVVDCASLPESLVESTLFGHEKGAFTGADQAQDGLIKHAHGGTLFLDEVGELPLRLQKAFLRVLQEHRFRPIGSTKERDSDFRLIAATNKDLKKMVEEGLFREDLLFRLHSFEIELPPLKDRIGDIRDLVIHHVAKICRQHDLETKGISPELFEVLEAYDWPGNVRELVNSLERAVAVARKDPLLIPKHLPAHIRIRLATSSLSKRPRESTGPSLVSEKDSIPPIKEFRSLAERQYLQELMERAGWEMDKAKQIARVSLPRLYALLRKHGLERMRNG